MSQENFESSARLDSSKRLKNFIVEVDIGSKRHFEGKAVSESDIFANSLEKGPIFGSHNGLGGET